MSPEHGRAPEVWEWDVEGDYKPRYDAKETEEGLAYGCEIKGAFCGWDSEGSQTWAQFLEAGPPADIHMPPRIEAQIRAHVQTRNRSRGGSGPSTR